MPPVAFIFLLLRHDTEGERGVISSVGAQMLSWHKIDHLRLNPRPIGPIVHVRGKIQFVGTENAYVQLNE